MPDCMWRTASETSRRRARCCRAWRRSRPDQSRARESAWSRRPAASRTGRVQFVDVILVDHRLVKPAQAGGDLLRQLRLAVVKQPGQEEAEQARQNRDSGKDQFSRVTSLRLGPSVSAPESQLRPADVRIQRRSRLSEIQGREISRNDCCRPAIPERRPNRRPRRATPASPAEPPSPSDSRGCRHVHGRVAHARRVGVQSCAVVVMRSPPSRDTPRRKS